MKNSGAPGRTRTRKRMVEASQFIQLAYGGLSKLLILLPAFPPNNSAIDHKSENESEECHGGLWEGIELLHYFSGTTRNRTKMNGTQKYSVCTGRRERNQRARMMNNQVGMIKPILSLNVSQVNSI